MVALLEIILLATLGLFVCYLAFLSLCALVARGRSSFPASRQRKFAVVVPAHNEELSIRKTIESLRFLHYPEQLFSVVIIADNCTDRTAVVAGTSGALVYERNNPSLKGKGQALRWMFDRLLDSPAGYDAFVVIDADSIVSANFLTVMNHYLDRGAAAIQAADLVLPQKGSWSPEITRLAFTLYNYARPLGRKVLGCSAGLRGNGMCFSAETLRHLPWQAYSLTEDLEYGLILLLNKKSVAFAPEAAVYATMPESSTNAVTQRARWEAGRIPVIRTYVPKLLRHALGHRSFQALDAAVDLLTPPFVNLLMMVVLLAGLHFLAILLRVPAFGVYSSFWLVLLAAGAAHVVLGLIAARADRSLYLALLYVPRYAFWKLTVYVRMLNSEGPREWVRTTRETQSRPDNKKNVQDSILAE